MARQRVGEVLAFGHGGLPGGWRAVALAVRAVALLGVVAAILRAVVVGGIYGGVESPLPVAVRAETLARMEAAVDERSAVLLERGYGAPNGSGVRMLGRRGGEVGEVSATACAALLAETRLAGAELEPARAASARFVLREMEAVGYDVAHLRATYIWSRIVEAAALLSVGVGCSVIARRPLACPSCDVSGCEAEGTVRLCLYKDRCASSSPSRGAML